MERAAPGGDSQLAARLARRLGLVAVGALALIGLLAYFLVVHYRSARTLRENLMAQRAQEVRLHAAAVRSLLDSAEEAVRNAASSSEVDAFFKNRDLGMSMEYGLRLTLVPIADRLRAAVEDTGPRDRPVLSRVVLLEEGGPPLAASDRLVDPTAQAELASARELVEGVRIGPEGRSLLVVRRCLFKGRVVARLVGWVSPQALEGVLPRGQRPSLVLADGDGGTFPPGSSAQIVEAALESVPPDGAEVELPDPTGAHLVVRVPVPGQPFTVLQIDRASELVGSLSPLQSVLGLTAAALAVLAGAALAFFFSARSLVLGTRLEESVHSRRELEEQHRALQREVAARQRLEAAHARLAQAVDQAAEALALTGPDGTFEYVNPAFERITGYALGDLHGPAELDASDPEEAPTLGAAFESPSEFAGQVKVRRRDGAVALLEVLLSPVRGPSGETVSRVLAARDVTEEHRLRDQLRHAQRLEAVGTLAGGVAHDFNNLLSVINGYAGMALAGLPADHPAREDVKEILAAGGRAATLTRQLLAFGRRQVLRLEVLDLNEVVGGIEKMLRRLIPENIELVTRPAPSLRRVRVDPGQLEQVLVNLVVNARDAMPRGGRIEVSTEDALLPPGDPRLDHETPPGPYVRLAVRDDGAGMDEPTRVRCFEPFFTTKAPGKGTGLGLSTVYGIVRQSRGIVRVESAPDQGAVFELYFPVHEGEVAAARGLDAGQRAGPARPGETVLVVEDEAQLRELLRTRLSAQGYNTLAAAHGAEALEMAAAHTGRIDVLLSDVVMPQLSGPELARRFRERFPGAAVVFMTGYAEEAVARQGLADAAAVIEKPSGLESVTAVIRDVLDAAGERV
jgi:PAS domain S-box-containing protein